MSVNIFQAVAAATVLVALALLLRRHPTPYLRLWVLGQMLFLISATSQHVELTHPTWMLAWFVSDLTVLGHSLFYWAGIQLFAGKSPDPRPYVAAAIAIVAYAWFSAFVVSNHALTRPFVLPFVVTVYFLLSRLFFQQARQHPYAGLKLAAWSFLAHGSLFLIYPLSFYEPAIRTIGYLASGAITLLIAFAFLLIPTEHAEAELKDLKQSLEHLVEERTRQLIQQERLAAIGQVAAGVAHEIKNKLNVINASAYYLVHRLPPDPDLEKAGGYIRDNVLESGRILTDLLQIGRPSSPRVEPLAVTELVASMASMVVPKRVRVVTDLAPDLPLILADRQQLEQILLNLLLNAVEAMPEGGMITFRAQRRIGEVEISLTDTGIGIDPDLAAHLFEPFHTTKPKGTGLGLAISRSLIEQQRGRLSLESVPGQGTTARIILPSA